MPVPVPRHSKASAHPVLKPHNRIPPLPNQVLSGTGLTPSIGSGENWSVPWAKHSHLPSKNIIYPTSVQDFYSGLTATGDAVVIKGAHAEAYIPPMHNVFQDHNAIVHANVIVHNSASSAVGYNVRSGFTTTEHALPGVQSLWITDHGTKEECRHTTCQQHVRQGDTLAACFTPILEDHSPGSVSGPDIGSSPLEPLTPFTDFVDRAVGTAQPDAQQDDFDDFNQCQEYQVTREIPQALTFPTIADIPVQEHATSSTSFGYKRLVGPLSEWIANYVWRVCTTGYSLPPAFQQTTFKVPHAAEVSDNLASSIQGILLATLLQPSAIYLSLWYMVRLPVYFGAAPLGAELPKAAAFQASFLGECQLSLDHDVIEQSALRLVVLGFMLANKWLDDHTFSNKTWHTISNIPVQTLNILESRALDAFSYDLSISNQDWSQWLSHVMAYHVSLASPGRPQPISRPSSNPHMVVRRSIEELMQTPVECKSSFGVPRPVFVGIEQRLHDKEAAMAVEVLEIDLDEDGPLREEYLPKRRASRAIVQDSQYVNEIDSIPVTLLPPPAKWSPSADEPIQRERPRSSGQYVAVQAPQLSSAVPAYPSQNDMGYNPSWINGAAYMPVKHIGYSYEIPTFFRQPAHNPFGENATTVLPHLQSGSCFYDQNSLRSYPPCGFGYGTAVGDDMETRWPDGPHYSYSGPAYLPLPAVAPQPSW